MGVQASVPLSPDEGSEEAAVSGIGPPFSCSPPFLLFRSPDQQSPIWAMAALYLQVPSSGCWKEWGLGILGRGRHGLRDKEFTRALFSLFTLIHSPTGQHIRGGKS